MRLIFCTFVMLTRSLADPGFLPVVWTETISVQSTSAYAELVAEANQAMNDRHDTPLFLRAYVRPTITGSTHTGFVLSPSGSLADLLSAQNAFATDPALRSIREKLKMSGWAGPTRYLKAIRFDGTHTPGWLFNSWISSSDESRLLEQVEKTAKLLVTDDQTRPLINVFRVIEGLGSETHLISLNAGSSAALADRLEHLSSRNNPLEDPAIEVYSRTLFREVEP